jgi:hypothetical protein
MLRTLRCSRLLALALLIVTPGALGTLVQSLHSCPIAAPWMQPAEAEGGHHHGHPSDPGSAPEPCQCVGTCQAPTPWAAPASRPQIAAHPVAHSAAPPIFANPGVAPARPDRFLPPATAPPRG